MNLAIPEIHQAYNLCLSAHAGQFRHDKVTPYSSHPIAVAEMMTTTNEVVLALLHDVVEDTHITIEYIESNYSFHPEVIFGLKHITKQPDVDYQIYLCGVTDSSLAVKVKIADMFHNISCSPSDNQKAKYQFGLKYLLSTI